MVAIHHHIEVLSPQAFQLSGLFGRNSGTHAAINLGLAHPLAHRLCAADPQQPRDFADRRPLRLVLITDLGDHPHRPLTQLRRVPPRRTT